MECNKNSKQPGTVQTASATKMIKVALIGPPNVGKSALFYQLTGKICKHM